jgi:hypothetical protein
MWRIQKMMENGAVVLNLSGRIEGEQLAELQRVIASEEPVSRLVLDLNGMRLVDQEVVTYLAWREASGTTLRNCPFYIREWIVREARKES